MTKSKHTVRFITLCTSRKLTCATAESCTGGLLSETLTRPSGASSVFLAGLVTYSNQAKIDLLGVPSDIISKYGAVSKETARAMVLGLQRRLTADICVSTTGIAGPSGGSPDKPVGTVYVGFYFLDTIWVEKYRLNGCREDIRQHVVDNVILTLLTRISMGKYAEQASHLV